MNKIANRAIMCQALMKAAETDRNVTVLCSDSRGSGSMTPFAEQFPAQFVDTGIAEQNLVGIAAGMASCGKRRMRSLRQVFFLRAAMSRRRLIVPIPGQMSN